MRSSFTAVATLGCLLLATPACDTEENQGQVSKDGETADVGLQDAVDPACPAPESLDDWNPTVPCSAPGLTCPGKVFCSVYGQDVDATCTCRADGTFECDYWCEGADVGPPPADIWQDAAGSCPAPDSLSDEWWNVSCSPVDLVCPGVMWCPIYADYVDGDCSCTAAGTFDCYYWCEGPDIGPPPVDTGPTDSGMHDAGTEEDAGPEEDAKIDEDAGAGEDAATTD